MKKDILRLCRRIAILAVLSSSTAILTSPPMTSRVFADNLCGYCQPYYNYSVQRCNDSWFECLNDNPGYSNCFDLYESCLTSAQAYNTSCLASCETTPPHPPPLGRTKSPCQQACYAWVDDCMESGGVPDVEDCIDSGGSAPYCCVQTFHDCMDGCGP